MCLERERDREKEKFFIENFKFKTDFQFSINAPIKHIITQ